MATIETVRQALGAKPFRPVSLRLVDDVAIPPVKRPREIIYYAVTNGDGEEYQGHTLDLGLIMEVITPKMPATSPGAF
jgi:hypothetical protein